MNKEKLLSDTQTLHRFIQLHCDKKHHDVPKKKGVLEVSFKEEALCELPYHICEECETLSLSMRMADLKIVRMNINRVAVNVLPLVMKSRCGKKWLK